MIDHLREHRERFLAVITQNAPRSAFNVPPIGRIFDSFGMPNLLVDVNRKEDGTVVYSYNLAGFAKEEIHIQLDKVSHELSIKAESANEANRKVLNTSLILTIYTVPEDISASYQNGILDITVAPSGPRQEEAQVNIPLA